MSDPPCIEISIQQQALRLWQGQTLVREYPVSTAVNGPGEQNGSGCTPRGPHIIRARIGAGLPAAAVLAGRRPTGEIYNAELAAQYPQRDWILSRILWLSGTQPGFNRLGPVDTMRRYIYIHGCPDEFPMGVPLSHGCIRMHNAEVIDLFERAAVGTEVMILEGDFPAE